MIHNVISEGRCECIFEPSGDGGLEGFNLGDKYRFQACENDRGRYYRIFTNDLPNHYETCGPKPFNRHFKRLMEKSVEGNQDTVNIGKRSN